MISEAPISVAARVRIRRIDKYAHAEFSEITLCPPTVQTDGGGPHQFRSRNDLNRIQRT